MAALTRGEVINERARAGASVVRARENLERARALKDPRRRAKEVAISRRQLLDALGYYGQCLWNEERWPHAQLTDAPSEEGE